MRLGILKETQPEERRVALVPGALAGLAKRGVEIWFETGAGAAAGYPDHDYAAAGGKEAVSATELMRAVDGFLLVSPLTETLLSQLRREQLVVGLLDPLADPEGIARLAERGVMAFALELLPRVTRAQSMDALSSMANLAGYKAAVIAAAESRGVFPMMTTAAGTLPAARVLVLGAGVAGLQAIATAKRLGAIVEAYDIRPEVKEQVQSVGGRFVEIDLGQVEAGTGGYAAAQPAEVIERQRDALGAALARADAVITTALVPGARAPRLVTTEMLARMRPGSVVVDLAAEQGGNCEGSLPGETVVVGGVRVMGPVNLPSTLAFHASQLLSKNFVSFLAEIVSTEGTLTLREDDPIATQALVTRHGEVVSERVKELSKSRGAPSMTAT